MGIHIADYFNLFLFTEQHPLAFQGVLCFGFFFCGLLSILFIANQNFIVWFSFKYLF